MCSLSCVTLRLIIPFLHTRCIRINILGYNFIFMNMTRMGIYHFTSVFYKHGEGANCFVHLRCFTVTGKATSFYITGISLAWSSTDSISKTAVLGRGWGRGRKFKYEVMNSVDIYS